MLYRPPSFRKSAIALTTAAAMVALASFPVAAQQASAPISTPQVLTGKQCSDAVSISLALVKRNEGKISRDLVDSFVRFGKSNCDLNTDWKLKGKADEDVFGEFRVRLIAMRTASRDQKNTLAQR